MDAQSIAALCMAIIAIATPFVLFLSRDWVREDIKRIIRNRWRKS